jgi:hypothetical protein
MRNLTPKHIDTSGDMIVLTFEDHAGELCEAKLSSMDAATLMFALERLIQEVVEHPQARSPQLPGMRFVQYIERAGDVFFRVSVAQGVFHDYPVPKNTTLAEELRLFADRMAARQEAKVTHSPPGSPSGKH